MKALYIHIPFCNNICTYCDFYKRIAKDEMKEKYITYLLKELEMRKELLNDIETVYIGGGTPSSLSATLLNKLFLGLKKQLNFSKIKEFTFEANPADVNESLVSLLKENKVNRVSLGVQSVNKKKLIFLGRNHKKKNVKVAMKLLKENGITNINCDIIFGTPKDKIRLLKKDLKLLIKLGATHISAYSLQLEEKTILYRLYKQNKFVPVTEEYDSEMFKFINGFLKEKGFTHYEVSNYAKGEEFKSLHNLVYWNNEHYLGIGTASSYYIDDFRYTNINNIEKYFEGLDKGEILHLEESELVEGEKMFEEVMLGLRKIEGFSINNFKEKYQKDVFEVYPVINGLITKGDLILKGEYLKVPEEKIFILNNILLNFLN